MSISDTPPPALGTGGTGGTGGQADNANAKWTKWGKATLAIIPLLALAIATWTAWQGQITVNRSNRATLDQAEDAQLSTAITAIGSNNTSEEISGLLLLARNTGNRFALMGQTDEPPAEVFGDYTTALQILSGYLKGQTDTLLGQPGMAAVFGIGYGVPPPSSISPDFVYAANQVSYLLSSDMQAKVDALNVSTDPAIDLSNVELFGQPWTGVDFSWVSAYMVNADLRGASLNSSQWSKSSDLSGSDLQCADLQNANFQGANLSNADLEGAYIQGADFRGADLKGAVVGQVYGKAIWSSPPPGITTVSARRWNQDACLQNKSLWRGQPIPVSGPSSSPVSSPSSSPAPKPSASASNAG